MSKRRKRREGRAGAGKAFDPDYTYVYQDLRRIGALAFGFIGLLIALSFFLN